MLKRKNKALLDWYGNPIPTDGPIPRNSRLTFKGEITADGKKRIRAYRSDGTPTDSTAIEDWYLRVEDKDGKVLYDSRLNPPADAKLLPGYVGFEIEKQLKRYFPG